MVAEGCYPFVVGGVSSWVHSLIQLFPKTEFIILAIAANRSQRGKYAYELPQNVSAVYELYLDDVDWGGSKKRHKHRLKKEQYQALRSLLLDQDIEWNVLFDLFRKEDVSLNALLMGEDFLNAVKECYNLKYSQIVFSDFLWTMRSIYLPLFLTMQTELPKADLYHCVATGYAGVLGAMAKHFYGSRLLISEHGIYTREREEELIKAKWVAGIYKNIWIDQFRKMSKLAYNEGTLITSLFEHARELQVELGCPVEKTMVTPNGIRVENLQNIPGKTEEDAGMVNIGAVLRVTPIKDVKTMIQAFVHIAYGDSGYTREMDRDCYEKMDVIYTVSGETRRHFLEFYPEYEEKVQVFHNIIDRERIEREAKKPGGFSDSYDGVRILTVGRLAHQKAYDIAILAMKQIRDAGYKARWYVVGEGPERKALEKQIAELRLQKDFILLGIKENPFPYYAQCDLYVHATRFEGKSIAIQEAQALGCAVIASDCAGNREQIEDGVDGLLCLLTPEGIARKIEELIDDTEKKERIVAAAKQKGNGQTEEIQRMLDLMK